METIEIFLNFFQDFINLCQAKNWPNDLTKPEEIRNAFLISQHIEKCLDKFQKRSLIDEFLSLLNNKQNASTLFLKKCFSEPPKYILKKILNSSANISLVDVGFTIFVELFSEQKSEVYLSELMLEAASQETLLQNVKTELPKDVLLDFKSKYLLSELSDRKNSEKIIENILSKCTKDDMDMLVQCLLCKDLKYNRSVNIVIKVLLSFMSGKDAAKKNFWKLIFIIDEEKFLQVCLNHGDIFKSISNALVDCGKLIKKNMSMEYFYIELTYSELERIVQMVCKNENLKVEFLDSVLERDEDSMFWNNLML